MNGKRSPDGFPQPPPVILATMGKQLEMAMLTPHLSLEDQAADPETTSL
jgi:hypothetical protein